MSIYTIALAQFKLELFKFINPQSINEQMFMNEQDNPNYNLRQFYIEVEVQNKQTIDLMKMSRKRGYL